MEEAPICNSAMRVIFRYNIDSGVGKEVLEERLEFEDNLDEHTRGVLQEVAHTQRIVPQDSVDNIICPGAWGSF
jgi:hypothetical protein